MTAPYAIKGWCPGALRPMQTGDGLIVRARISGGVVSSENATELANLSETCGNGLLEISQRANLQLRGVSEATLPVVQQGLAALGLLDADAAREAIRNVIVSPLAGVMAPKSSFPTKSIVTQLEQALAGDPALLALPAKFGFLIDDGTWPGLGAVAVDIRLVAQDQGFDLEVADAKGFAVAGSVRPEDAAAAAIALAQAFLRLRISDRRMADLVRRIGAGALATAAGLGPAIAVPRPAVSADVIGRHTLSNDVAVIGVGLPLGQMTAAQFRVASNVAATWGRGEVRLTPFRALLIPVWRGAEKALAILAEAGFITDPLDSRRAVVACAGAPRCAHGEVPSRDDALVFAEVAHRRGIHLHVSGCGKGCAHPGVAAATLVGRAGAYDLITKGRTGDVPVATGLNRAAALDLLGRMDLE